MLSQYTTPSYALALLEGGCEGRAYLLKERVKDIDQLVAAIHAVSEGGDGWTRGRRRARRGERPSRGVAAERADAARTRRAARDGRGPKQRRDRRDALLTERSVEKVIHSVFLKLGLTWEEAVHKRVKAVVLYLGESG